ncbi:hypothetical protein [Shimazuella kribbensis]|uniref:hypothetical protein n=1 Tax=Shimazuella kribbensis TaxID=139808 RepID=UPI00048D7F92|nr:hypothetical protein [Shimazuella kribbensis]
MTKQHTIIMVLRRVIANLIQSGGLASLPNGVANPLNNLKEAERLLKGDWEVVREALLKAVENFSTVLQSLVVSDRETSPNS